MSDIQIWQGPNGLTFPANVKNEHDIVPYANLSEKQKMQIVSAFQIEAYDMASEYAWKKAMTKLKETIATLGMEFVGEMLGRQDIDETTPIDSVITNYSAIQLAEQLGVINTTAALKLRHCDELITHFFSKNAKEDLDYNSAVTIVKSAVQYILYDGDISIAIEFTNFRERLLNETLKIKDDQVQQLLNSPLFYLRTVISILLTSIKNDIGAKLENSLGNLNTMLPDMWANLGESDKWNIGSAYRDVTAAGNTLAVSGLKNALLKVNGFDYVPENLRSITFIQAAKQVLEAHFGNDNFYNEPPVVRKLSQLGNTIPAPALVDCFQAYLAVYLGNSYNISYEAAPIAEEELSNISKERWKYYFEKVIQTDDIILSKIEGSRVGRFSRLLHNNGLTDFKDLPKTNQDLYNAIIDNKSTRANDLSTSMYYKIKNKK